MAELGQHFTNRGLRSLADDLGLRIKKPGGVMLTRHMASMILIELHEKLAFQEENLPDDSRFGPASRTPERADG